MARSLRYSRPSDGWLDALPLGNGRLGAMVEAGPEAVRLQLNDGTAWSGSPHSEHRHGAIPAGEAARALAAARSLLAEGRPVDAERELAALQSGHSQAYLPLADLTVRAGDRTAGDARGGFSRTLSLGDATHSVECVGTGNTIQHDTFISAPDGVLVHRVRSTAPVRISLDLRTPLRETSRDVSESRIGLEFELPADVAPRHERDEPPLTWDLDGVAPLRGAVVVGWRSDGRSRSDGDRVEFEGVRDLVIVLATQTTFAGLGSAAQLAQADALRRAIGRVEAALSSPFEELLGRHILAHRALFDRVSLSLGAETTGTAVTGDDIVTDPDLRLEMAAANDRLDPELLSLLFDHGRYLLVSSSRPGGLPATLQGLWNSELQPPWSSNYTLNINTAMNYWAAEALRLPECHEPLLDLVEALAASGAATARRLYDCRGWVAHHNTDAWAFSSPTSGDASWSQWPMGGVWLVLQLDEHRRSGAADAAWLHRFWAVAAGAAEFALNWLVDDGEGRLVTCPSTSPENRFRTPDGPASLVTASALDRALLLDLFSTIVDLAAELGHRDSPLVAEVLAASARLDGPRMTPSGEIEEWGAPVEETEPHHRHVSHLYPLYPGRGLGSAQLDAAASRSLDRRGDDSTGWSLVWKLCLRARLGQPEKVADLLRLVFRPVDENAVGHAGGLYRNFFAAHPPFQIDGNLGFPAAVIEMLVQSHAGVLSLLPALPVELPEGRVRGLVARPGILIDLDWAGGVLQAVALRARSSGAEGLHTIAYRGSGIPVRIGAGAWTTLAWDGAGLVHKHAQQETVG